MSSNSDLEPYPPWTSGVPPAPGDLRVIQAFVNTYNVNHETEALESIEDLTAWLAHWKLTEKRAAVTEPERRQALDLREGLRQLLLANNGDESDSAERRRLEQALVDLPLRCDLRVDGTFELVGVTPGWPQAAARMLTIVTRAMAAGAWRRLKACKRHECQWVFYDASKNRSGKWCAMAGCGDLMKARAYRERLRARSDGSPG